MNSNEPNPKQRMREIITASATRDKNNNSKIAKVLRHLDDLALSRDVKIAEEGMKGYKA